MRQPLFLIMTYIIIIFLFSLLLLFNINLEYSVIDKLSLNDIILSVLISITITLLIFIKRINDVLLKYKKSIEDNYDTIKKLTKYISENIKKIKDNETRKKIEKNKQNG